MRSRLTVFVTLASVVLAGCTAREGGTATPASGTPEPPPSSAGPSTSAPDDDVPKVDTPLDVSAFINKPCTALTQAQIDTLGVADAVQDTEPTGQYCRWSNARGAYVNVAFVAGRHGLGGFYAGNEAGQYKLFEEIPDVSGYPAVVAMLSDQRKDGDCSIAIGVDDDIALSVATAQSAGNVGTGDPCQVSVDVAKLILDTVKAGG